MASRPRRSLGLLDSTSIIVGIIIGVGIYRMAPDVARGVSSWGTGGLFLLWGLGGLISLCGALGYAELAAAWPKQGGDLVYLTKAYGKWAGFLFGWAQLTIIRPGDIAVMAFAFVTYVLPLIGLPAQAEGAWSGRVIAAIAIAVLTAINIVGVREGKWTQNILTAIKVVGLVAIVGIAFAGGERPDIDSTLVIEPLPWSLALVFVLFTYGGWNEMAYVAAEVKNPNRNILRALILGTLAVTALYLLINAAFIHRLGYHGLATGSTPAVDTVTPLLGSVGGKMVAVLVCLSALGAINGLIFTGARITYALGQEHSSMKALGGWSGSRGTPVRALLMQGVLAIGLVLFLGSLIDTLVYTAAAVYTFYFATSAAVFVLRAKDPDAERPYRVTWFPIPTLLFMGFCGYLIYSCIKYAINFAPLSLPVLGGIVVLGVVIYLLGRKSSAASAG